MHGSARGAGKVANLPDQRMSFFSFSRVGLLIGSRCKKFHSDKVCRDRKCVTAAAGKQRRRRPDETDTGGGTFGQGEPALQKEDPCVESVVVDAAAAARNERLLTLCSAKARGVVNGFHVRASEQETQRRRGRVSARIKRPSSLPCVYLTAKIPSIRDGTTAAKAIIPHLTLIKVIIVFLLFFFNAKSTKPDQYKNTIKLDRCGPSLRRRKNTCKNTLGCVCQRAGSSPRFRYALLIPSSPHDTRPISGGAGRSGGGG